MRSVKISVVFAVLQKVVVIDLLLHVFAVNEPVAFAALFQRAWWPTRVWNFKFSMIFL